jgi:methylenetetrahydrofolate dehydrogenase (NADP+)/methenyltetrahydrofolate cyclohydrolase/formyltetrahydrofolate synthetase
LPKAYSDENLELVRLGCANMQHHVRNAIKFGVPVVVAINQLRSAAFLLFCFVLFLSQIS